ncbi:MAG: murein hydrolase activator EnvC family protein [Panacagrimonas sp.]
MAIIALRSKGLKALASITLLALASLVPEPACADDEIKRQSELKQLRARVAELDRALAEDRRNQDRLRGDIESAEKDLAAATRQVREAEAALSAQRSKLKAAQQATAAALEQVESRRADLGQALRASYMAGSPGRLQLMFRLEDRAALDRLDVDAAAIAQALEAKLSELQRRIEELGLAEQQLALEQAELEQREAASRKALAALKQSQQKRRGALDEVAKRGQSREAELKQARADQARVEQLLESLRRALKDSPNKFERGTPFKNLRGRLPWPLRGQLLARFGSTKGEGPLTWSGWWIQSASGAPVRAVADGRAVYVGWVQRYGLVVILDHPGPYLSLYGHLETASIEVGEVVAAGDSIGRAGNSGGHELSGVYFEIRQGTNAVDPKPWLAP